MDGWMLDGWNGWMLDGWIDRCWMDGWMDRLEKMYVKFVGAKLPVHCS